jgi:hypothetical protein
MVVLEVAVSIKLPLKNRHPELVSGSIAPHTPPYRRQTQSYRQINPFRVDLIDQVYLPRPMPILQLLFAGNRGGHVRKHFEVYQPVDGIFGRMSRRRFGAILRQAFEQIRRNANVYRAIALTDKDIDARVSLISHWRSLAAKWTLKQVQGDGIFEGSLLTQRHPELVSGSIGRLAPFWRLAISSEAI